MIQVRVNYIDKRIKETEDDSEEKSEDSMSPEKKRQKNDNKISEEKSSDINNKGNKEKSKEHERKQKENEENEISIWSEEDVNIWDKHLMKQKEYTLLKKCIDCGDKYGAEYESKTKENCIICKVNEHDCIKDKSSKLSKGYVWICNECKETIGKGNTDIIEKFRKEMVKKVSNGKNEVSTKDEQNK
ncbi:unnamed protein product, partial [Meganyctiphanes norvegica]